MNLLSWMRYCRERCSERHTADELNYGDQFAWIDDGEEGDCSNCNPWRCVDCCDGFGISCGKNDNLFYYIPDPYDESDCCGRKDWKQMIKWLPSPYGEQLKLF